tara:strand:- start:11097 stop:11582 length:486 start_codon:yes stop_codon:yes gene_type:complete
LVPATLCADPALIFTEDESDKQKGIYQRKYEVKIYRAAAPVEVLRNLADTYTYLAMAKRFDADPNDIKQTCRRSGIKARFHGWQPARVIKHLTDCGESVSFIKKITGYTETTIRSWVSRPDNNNPNQVNWRDVRKAIKKLVNTNHIIAYGDKRYDNPESQF